MNGLVSQPRLQRMIDPDPGFRPQMLLDQAKGLCGKLAARFEGWVGRHGADCGAESVNRRFEPTGRVKPKSVLLCGKE